MTDAPGALEAHRSSVSGGLTYMPQLDSLRALAVLGVMISHFVQQVDLTGRFGVRFFFVLSGFLITTLLLRARTRIDVQGSGSIASELRTFYTRRFLRLFPALALLIVVCLAFNVETIRSTWQWHLSYLSNVYFAREGHWALPFAIFWSLSVEEQFYLAWPFFVLLVPRRFLSAGCVAAIGAGVLWKAGGIALHMPTPGFDVLPIASLDTLGFGGLLALAMDGGEKSLVSLAQIGSLARGIALSSMVVLMGGYIAGHAAGAFYLLVDVVTASVFAWIVGAAAQGIAGLPGRVLSFRPLIYLGQISYGLYLFHAFTPRVIRWSIESAGFDQVSATSGSGRLALFCVYVAVTVAAASLSAYFWERPFRSLGRRPTHARAVPVG